MILLMELFWTKTMENNKIICNFIFFKESRQIFGIDERGKELRLEYQITVWNPRATRQMQGIELSYFNAGTCAASYIFGRKYCWSFFIIFYPLIVHSADHNIIFWMFAFSQQYYKVHVYQ